MVSSTADDECDGMLQWLAYTGTGTTAVTVSGSTSGANVSTTDLSGSMTLNILDSTTMFVEQNIWTATVQQAKYTSDTSIIQNPW